MQIGELLRSYVGDEVLAHVGRALALDSWRYVHPRGVLEPVLEILRNLYSIGLEGEPAPPAAAEGLDERRMGLIAGLEPAQVHALCALRPVDGDASAPALPSLVVGYGSFAICVLSHLRTW